MKTTRIILVISGCLVLIGTALRAETPVLELGLKDVERAALENSASLRAAANDLDSAGYRSWAAMTAMLPRLSLDGTWRYQTEVPSLQLSFPRPLKSPPAIPFGDHTNYSAGATVNWNLFDSGVSCSLWRSAQALERARGEELKAGRNEMRLRARLAYFQAQLASEQARLLAEDLKLTQNRDQDMRLRFSAGDSSRIDALAARNEVLLSKGRFRQAQLELSGALRDLLALTGLGASLDPSLPEDLRSEEAGLPQGLGRATLALKMDGLQDSLLKLKDAEKAALDNDQPRLAELRELVEAAQKQADAAGAGHWLKVQASGRASLDYPDGPVLENVWQKTAFVSATLPIFSFGQTYALTGAEQKSAQAARERETQAHTDLRRDWLKARDQLASLNDLKALYAESVKETAELYRLVYDAYRNGSSSFLEVQDAAVKALQAKVQAARVDAQILIQLAILDSLGE
jgi:outer membrane protein TolC